jgi:HprK-related kinase A
VTFVLDGREPFDPFPADTHLPMLEWGLNWAIANRSNTTLLLHAGAVERGGRCVLLPALPGSGKSTLTAALATRGYRLLSDEFGAVRLADGLIMPALRPISLKNESIDIIRRFAPDATIGPVFPRTRKGSVAHFAPDAVSAAKRHEPATPALIVFPRFRAGAGTTLEPMPRSQAFTKLAANSFNYEVLGPEGFEAMGRLIERCACFRLSYSRLEEAIEVIGAQLSRTTAGQAASQAGAVPAST